MKRIVSNQSRHVRISKTALVTLWIAWRTCPTFGLPPDSDARLDRHQFSQVHMGVPFKLVLYAADEATANVAAAAAYKRVAELDRIMSDYSPDSELSRLSTTAGKGSAVPVSSELWLVLSRGQQLAAATEGAFDITVGPYVRLWRRARRTGEFPAQQRLETARLAVGYRHLRLETAPPDDNTGDDESSDRKSDDSKSKGGRSPGTAELLEPNMRLDLGGIAMGYAADQALAVLARHGITRALVDASGDIVVGEPPPGRDGWTIGVAPAADGPPSCYVRLAHAAVTTSGDAFQHVEIGGRRYSHIVDPRTGLGLTDQSGVTVIAPDGMTADSLATAVSVLGPEHGLELIGQTEGTAALIVRNLDGRLERYKSQRFASFETKPEARDSMDREDEPTDR